MTSHILLYHLPACPLGKSLTEPKANCFQIRWLEKLAAIILKCHMLSFLSRTILRLQSYKNTQAFIVNVVELNSGITLGNE